VKPDATNPLRFVEPQPDNLGTRSSSQPTRPSVRNKSGFDRMPRIFRCNLHPAEKVQIQPLIRGHSRISIARCDYALSHGLLSTTITGLGHHPTVG
jgi:hypothetical protein